MTATQPKDRRLQRRQEKYAAMGPYCPNGHAWATNAKFNYRGYRFCDTCSRKKAEKRRNDPTTYVGTCRHGHAYTRENTLITNWNGKVCLACKEASIKGTALRIAPAKIQLVLQQAREGMYAAQIVGRNLGKKKVINSIVSQNTLVKIARLDTPEGREIKALLEQNSFRGRKPYKWSDTAERLLADEAAKPVRYEDVTERIKRRTGVSFSVTAIMTKAWKMKITRPARGIIRALPMSNTTGTDIYQTISACVPQHLDRVCRQEIISEMVLAALEGRLALEDAPRRYREFLRTVDRMFPTKFAPRSLDAPFFGDSTMTLGEMITTGLWQE